VPYVRLLYISIIGDSDDFAIEIVAGSWFEVYCFLEFGFLVVGPLGAVGGTAVGIIMLISLRENYGRKHLK
jgi:hypothetical protein